MQLRLPEKDDECLYGFFREAQLSQKKCRDLLLKKIEYLCLLFRNVLHTDPQKVAKRIEFVEDKHKLL